MNDFYMADMDLSHVDDVVLIERLSFTTPWTKEAFISELTRNKCARYRIILKDGRVIAYGGMWIMLDEAHITNIAVHPEFRGIGLGSMLMEDMISVARENGVHAMTLEVRVSNTHAIGLYKKYGFAEIAIRKGYYQDTGEDAIIMWKYNL
ncbi:ribosomal-protein-alanine N-acetyltransferase [Fonticella tunisiensis]|uniref:[Ribosomal protein bS18]-alanine N-acetyltransferase n=1 Tax=Fonticella tunisiensis TaxID=1096341 RepID=A0A4R7KTR1_9CLOT|nr:ribosomal protein S18-alanine N-acetyltransferase [Fonticella tunisiensis]TDT62438.1 ribosomal-protein-alanine N-acetyltransferase [Fonticella tunisiensis]